MLPGRARRFTRAATSLLTTAVALCVVGCGATTTGAQPPTVDPGSAACRAQWRTLGDTLTGRDQQVSPSDLADRWNSVIATVRYYGANATAQDCDDRLAQQQAGIARIEDLSTRLRQYDITYLMSALAPTATDYLLNPLPAARRVGQKLKQPPAKSVVQQALRTLQAQAAASVIDMSDGWDEANSVDLESPTAVDRAVSDLRFLAGDSALFQTCLTALDVLRTASLFRTPAN